MSRTTRDYKTLGDVIKTLPPGSFIARYVEAQSVLETSLVYDFWCALFCLSNAVTRWAVVARPRAPVRCNLYIILTAESGVTRKSSAVGQAQRVMELFNERTHNRIQVIHTKTTPERLEDILSESSKRLGYSHFSFIVSELVTALGSERYNLSMPGLLTDLFDSPSTRKSSGTVSRGSVELRNVYGTFLSASTPTWLTRAINPDVIEGGFTSRVFFVIADAPKQRVAWPVERDGESDEELADLLVGIYKQFAPERQRDLDRGSERRIQLDDKALRYFKDWYEGRTLGVDPFTTSFESREDGHVLKVAALLAVNEGRGTLYEDDVAKAIWLINNTVKEKSVELLAYQINNDFTDAIEKLRVLLLQSPGGIKHSDLVRKLQSVARAKRINTIIETLFQLGLIRKFEYQNPLGRPGMMYQATEAMKSSDFLRMVMETLDGSGE